MYFLESVMVAVPPSYQSVIRARMEPRFLTVHDSHCSGTRKTATSESCSTQNRPVLRWICLERTNKLCSVGARQSSVRWPTRTDVTYRLSISLIPKRYRCSLYLHPSSVTTYRCWQTI